MMIGYCAICSQCGKHEQIPNGSELLLRGDRLMLPIGWWMQVMPDGVETPVFCSRKCAEEWT